MKCYVLVAVNIFYTVCYIFIVIRLKFTLLAVVPV